MPMIDLKDETGNVRWITVFPFTSLELARSYVKNSSRPMKIVKSGDRVFWVLNTEDADWAVKCGYQEIDLP